MASLTIITITLGDLAALIRTFESFERNLDYSNGEFEWVIVDGACDQCVMDWVISLNAKTRDLLKINLLSEKDSGISDAFNKGTSLASCDHVLYLNSGDELAEGASDLLSVINDNVDADVISLPIVRWYSKSKEKLLLVSGDINFCRAMTGIYHCGIIFNKSRLSQNLYYDLDKKYAMDYALLVSICLLNGRFVAFNSSFPVARMRIGGLTSQKPFETFFEAHKVKRENFGFFCELPWWSWRFVKLCVAKMLR